MKLNQHKQRGQNQRVPAALVRICLVCVLGSPTPTLLIATTLNSKSTQEFKSLTVACIICPGTESGTRIKEFRIVMHVLFSFLLSHILATISAQRWSGRTKVPPFLLSPRSTDGTEVAITNLKPVYSSEIPPQQ